jgi:hypothetical protein
MLWRRILLLIGGLGLGLVLAGCASTRTLSTQVSSYGPWPADRKAGTFAFDRLPSQMAMPMEQDRIEAAALPALAAAGFRQVERDQAEVLVQVAAQVVQTNDYWASPYYWGGWWGYPYGPYRRYPGLYPGFYPGYYGWYGGYYNYPEYQREVGVLIRDRQSNQALYETHARYTNSWTSEAILPAMFEAALKDFPQPALSPRPVVVVLQPPG